MPLINSLKKISKTAYLAAFITFCLRAGQFMSLPFLAIYLTRANHLSSSQIGIILGIAGFVYSTTGIFNGMYVDRNSHKNSLILSLLLAGICYFGFAFSMRSFYSLLLLNASLGWFRSLAEVCALTMVAKNTAPENLSYAYSARFIGANLGVVLGPLIGAIMASHQSLFIFYIAGAINFILAIGMLFYHEQKYEKNSAEPKAKFKESFNEVIKNKTLINITLIYFVLWTIYSHIDTTIPQYIAHNVKNPAVVFGELMVTNAILCVLFQPYILRWAELTSLKVFGIIGCILFILAFAFLALSPTRTTMMLSIILMSFGELFTLPINGLLVMRIAPMEKIASYNGLANLGLLGMSVGPILGGIGLQYIGGRAVFMIDALLPLIAIYLYARGVED
jgi:predicted MFS family arabinose efflux permease